MKILYSHRIQSRDGQGVHLDAMVGALRSAGHTVKLVGPGSYESASLGGESPWVALARRHIPRILLELAEFLYSVPAAFRLWRACVSFRPDVIYERYNLFFTAGAWVARLTRTPYLVEVNAPLREERSRYGHLVMQRFARWSERYVWRSADRVLPVTRVLGDYLVSEGVEPSRIVVIHNGIDLEEFPQRERPARGDGARTVVLGFVGFVRAWHGLDQVILGMAEHPDATDLTLVVVGDGPARAELESLSRQAGIEDRVHFTGLAERQAVPRLLADFDIALQPAAVAYASPLKVFEYMATGAAIVAPDQANLREVLTHGKTALLFDPADPRDMWDSILKLARDPELSSSIGRAARATLISRDLTWKGNARRVVEIVTSLQPPRSLHRRAA